MHCLLQVHSWLHSRDRLASIHRVRLCNKVAYARVHCPHSLPCAWYYSSTAVVLQFLVFSPSFCKLLKQWSNLYTVPDKAKCINNQVSDLL